MTHWGVRQRISDIQGGEQPHLNILNQYAALPYVVTHDGLLVCLITSRGTKRWIIPKGWPKTGISPHDMAAREAKEEAGLTGNVSTELIGTYKYRKRLHLFASVMCRVSVFPLPVTRDATSGARRANAGWIGCLQRKPQSAWKNRSLRN